MLKGLIRSAGAAALVLTASTSVSAQEAGGVAGKGVDRATQRPSVGAQVHTAGTQGGSPSRTPGWADDPPELSSLVEFAREQSDLRVVLERYLHDKAAIGACPTNPSSGDGASDSGWVDCRRWRFPSS